MPTQACAGAGPSPFLWVFTGGVILSVFNLAIAKIRRGKATNEQFEQLRMRLRRLGLKSKLKILVSMYAIPQLVTNWVRVLSTHLVTVSRQLAIATTLRLTYGFQVPGHDQGPGHLLGANASECEADLQHAGDAS